RLRRQLRRAAPEALAEGGELGGDGVEERRVVVAAEVEPDGLIRVAHAAAPYRMTWVEMDVHEPDALASVRRASPVPIASLEAIYGRRQYRQYFERQAVD